MNTAAQAALLLAVVSLVFYGWALIVAALFEQLHPVLP